MRITRIKLAGFKSFVDPTTLHLPGNLTGVVGPNGCGKSNIVDAVMWVMGETSAKHLRGDSMVDVIFSGSTARKPVGQATVELIFDNSDGAVGGSYASFAEISIKRTVARDGVSSYYLNGGRCRRKDIVDVFLGTGLGARGGYSVIEQGMISRVIEAKPDELRGFLEEAAGISKYKERRRETENRIRHTNENLARVNDVREELEKQLAHLQRQAKAAEKYQELKGEERRLEGELLAIRWRGIELARVAQERVTVEHETALEAARADLLRVEAAQSEQRNQLTEASDQFNQRQSEFYAKSAEVSRLEQALQHNEDRRQTLQQDLQRARQSMDETTRLHDEDLRKQAELAAAIDELTPMEQARRDAEDAAAEQLRGVEERAEAWQREWDVHQREQAETARQEHAEQVRVELLQAGHGEALQRAEALTRERTQLDVDALERTIATHEVALREREAAYDTRVEEQQRVRSELQHARLELQAASESAHRVRAALAQAGGEESSLRALQNAALGRDRANLQEWLRGHGFERAGILAQSLAIEAGWERALETTLRLPLSTLCDDGLTDQLLGASRVDLPVARLGALDARTVPAAKGRPDVPLLSDKVQCPWAIEPLLAGVYAVPNLADALRLRAELAAHESVITPDGVWLGPNWVLVPGQEAAEAGVLSRQRALSEVTQRVAALREELAVEEERGAGLTARVNELESTERALTGSIQEAYAAITDAKIQISVRAAERTRALERAQAIAVELAQLAQQSEQGATNLAELRARLVTLRDGLQRYAASGEALNGARRALQAELDTARTTWRGAREARHEIALKLEGLRSSHGSVGLALARNARLVQELGARCRELESAVQGAIEPQGDLRAQLDAALQARLGLEDAMKASRIALEECEATLRALDEQHAAHGRSVAQRQQTLEQARLEERALQVRAQELADRLVQQGHVLASMLDELAPEATEEGWRERLDAIAARIGRLGPINLAAIDEYAQLSERKNYLDNQLADLTQALATLEDAMRKIDKETRTRFKETFDKVNSGLQHMFPVLFGGGHAYLEMTGEDLLETGVAVMARPPGKRNSTIHLLSGGEKALTALAFVFALFELNPAPFCLLDEVDAPLDDANVVRLTDMLRTMANRIQFLFVTHNKITMEIADQLIGVTMQEAGVSRLVSVNMEEAVALAETA